MELIEMKMMKEEKMKEPAAELMKKHLALQMRHA